MKKHPAREVKCCGHVGVWMEDADSGKMVKVVALREHVKDGDPPPVIPCWYCGDPAPATHTIDEIGPDGALDYRVYRFPRGKAP